MKHLTQRIGFLGGFLICAGLLACGLYLQYVEYQEPCPLCILQRVAYIALMILFLVAALHGPGRIGSFVYGGLLFLVAGLGAAVAVRHVWLQHLPKNQVPACGPGLEYMLQKFSLFRALDKILSGSGECAEAGWSFLGLTIAGWSLVWFVFLAVFSIWLAWLGTKKRDGQRVNS